MTDDNQQHDDRDADDDRPATNQLMRRGFDGVSLATENAATQALVAKSTADIQARWVMAMRRPRDIHQVRQYLRKECARPDFAKAAMYAVPRGGTTITGLSIRFAEVAMRCMGNMNCEAQTLYDSDDERVIRVIATDFETNSTWTRDLTVKKTVERKQLKRGQSAIRDRINSYGERVFIVEATDDDVTTKESAAISKASRTAILRLVPGYLQDEAKAIIKETVTNEAAKNPDLEKNQLFDAFAGIGILPAQVAEYLGHPLEVATPYELVELRMLFAALRSGEATWDEIAEGGKVFRDRMKAKASESIRTPASAAGAAPATSAPATTTTTTTTTTTKPAASSAPAPQTKPAQSSGKGTSAVKDKIKEGKAAAAAPTSTATTTAAEPAPEPTPAPKTAKPEVPPGEPPPRPGYEDRACEMCGVVVEAKETDPPGAICYACSQA